MVDVSLDPANANRHDEQSLDAVGRSIRNLGAGRSIVVDADGQIIGGEATYQKAIELGLDLQFVHTTGDKLVVVVRDDISEDDPRRRALAIADNKTAEWSNWDNERLIEQLRDLKNEPDLIASTGWTEGELESLLTANPLVDLDYDSEPEGFAEGQQFAEGGSSRVEIVISEELANDSDFKSDVYALCTKYGLEYRIKR